MAASRHTHASCNAVPLVWGSLRLAPITIKKGGSESVHELLFHRMFQLWIHTMILQHCVSANRAHLHLEVHFFTIEHFHHMIMHNSIHFEWTQSSCHLAEQLVIGSIYMWQSRIEIISSHVSGASPSLMRYSDELPLRWSSYTTSKHMNIWCIYGARMSPTLSGSSTL